MLPVTVRTSDVDPEALQPLLPSQLERPDDSLSPSREPVLMPNLPVGSVRFDWVLRSLIDDLKCTSCSVRMFRRVVVASHLFFDSADQRIS